MESEGCHLCTDAKEGLAEAAVSHPLEVRTVDVRSHEGRGLMHTHRAALSPLVLLDGAFFSQGRLPRRKLDTTLRQRFAAAPVPVDRDASGGAGRG